MADDHNEDLNQFVDTLLGGGRPAPDGWSATKRRWPAWPPSWPLPESHRAASPIPRSSSSCGCGCGTRTRDHLGPGLDPPRGCAASTDPADPARPAAGRAGCRRGAGGRRRRHLDPATLRPGATDRQRAVPWCAMGSGSRSRPWPTCRRVPRSASALWPSTASSSTTPGPSAPSARSAPTWGAPSPIGRSGRTCAVPAMAPASTWPESSPTAATAGRQRVATEATRRPTRSISRRSCARRSRSRATAVLVWTAKA